MAAADLLEPKPKKWPILLALLVGISSFFVLPHFLSKENRDQRRVERDAREMLRLKKLVEEENFRTADKRARIFLRDRPKSLRVGDAHYWLARSLMGRANQEPFPGVPVLEDASQHFEMARMAKFPTQKTLDGRLDVAQAYLDHGHTDKAVRELKELVDHNEKKAYLALSDALSQQAREEPNRKDELLKEAKLWVDQRENRADTDSEKVEVQIAKAKLLWQSETYTEMLDLLDQVITDFPKSKFVGDIRYQRAKALAQLGKTKEAIAEFQLARDQARTERFRHLSMLHLVSLYRQQRDIQSQREAEQLIKEKSNFAAHAQVLLGLYYLETGRSRPFRILLEGLQRMASPQVLDRERLGVVEMYATIRKVWNPPAEVRDEEVLLLLPSIVKEFVRLYPERLSYRVDYGAVNRTVADTFMLRSRERKRAQDLHRAAAYRERAAEYYYRCGDIFTDVAALGNIPEDLRSTSYRNAATAYWEGGWFPKSAELWYLFYGYRPKRNQEGLYMEGMSLSRAGIFRVKSARERDAIEALSDYILLSPAGSIRVPQGLLERGRIHLLLGEYTAAATDFERVTSGPFGISPETREWSEGKRLWGVAELERALALQADATNPNAPTQYARAMRRAELALSEYLTRYVEGRASERYGSSWGAYGLLAAYDYARLNLSREKWSEAERWFRTVLEITAKMRPEEYQEDHASEQIYEQAEYASRQSQFLLGESLLALGRDEDAYTAFGTAYSDNPTRPERLWGRIGQARAALRLGRLQKAKELRALAWEVFEKNEDLYKTTMAGLGEQYWKNDFALLDSELLRAELASGSP